MSTDARRDVSTPEWQLIEHQPPAPLRDIVSRYSGYVEKTEAPFLQRQVPGTRVPFIIPFGPELEVAGSRQRGNLRAVEGGFVAGIGDSYAVTSFSGTSAGIQVDFSPLVARAICGVPMSELSGRILDLEDVFGVEGSHLAEAVRDAEVWEQRFALIDLFLVRRLAQAALPSKGAVWAWSKLKKSGGRASASELAQGLGWSHKRLIREFRDQVGLPPKTVARVIRFEKLNQKLAAATGVCWADLAADCGYFDESHLFRDVVQFTGRTPREHLRSLRVGEAFQD
jgi:AraC-like DNA-binding protein